MALKSLFMKAFSCFYCTWLLKRPVCVACKCLQPFWQWNEKKLLIDSQMPPVLIFYSLILRWFWFWIGQFFLAHNASKFVKKLVLVWNNLTLFKNHAQKIPKVLYFHLLIVRKASKTLTQCQKLNTSSKKIGFTGG